MKIIEQVDVIISLIKENDCYKNYLESKEIISKDLQLYEKIKQFKHMQIEHYMSNTEISFEENKKISLIYSELSLNNNALQFLENEKFLLAYIEEIQNKISGIVSLEF